jgi:hypothetical protein
VNMASKSVLGDQPQSGRMKAPTPRLQLARAIREELEKQQSIPDDNRPPFVTEGALKSVWTVDRIRALVPGFEYAFNEDLVPILRIFSKILSILVWIRWDNWEAFQSIFLDYRDDEGKFFRCDNQLPFEDSEFLDTDEKVRRAFLDEQYMFIPIVIQELNGLYDEKWRLPFLNSVVVEYGDVLVTKELVAARQLLFNEGNLNQHVSTSYPH